ncbi:hypothetical protein ONZ45_g8454 [Pleurotus djamor]|nr:hypothetical protein ONZ45_g8454 [Pleurotus djamor]
MEKTRSTKPKLNVFITGATGYIGGTIVSRLLEKYTSGQLTINALVRSAHKTAQLSALGIKPIIGSLDDLDILQKLASEADVVISAANSDHMPSILAILKGQKELFERMGVRPILIHTSGAGVGAVFSGGMSSDAPTYVDSDAEQMKTLDPNSIHRNVDLKLVEADLAGPSQLGYTKTYIVLPSSVFGVAESELPRLGISNAHSVFPPLHIRASIRRGNGGMIGNGSNVWHNVHIEDLGDLYLLLFKDVTVNPDADHGVNGYYFAENGNVTHYEVAQAISQALVSLRVGMSPEPTQFSREEELRYFGKVGSAFLGSTSRCLSAHSRVLGWEPRYTTQDRLKGLRAETEIILKRMAEEGHIDKAVSTSFEDYSL